MLCCMMFYYTFWKIDNLWSFLADLFATGHLGTVHLSLNVLKEPVNYYLR